MANDRYGKLHTKVSDSNVPHLARKYQTLCFLHGFTIVARLLTRTAIEQLAFFSFHNPNDIQSVALMADAHVSQKVLLLKSIFCSM